MAIQQKLKYFILSSFFFFQCAVPAFSSAYYWVGNSGSWSDYSNHWATASGGTFFHTQEPTITDDVYFDANSFTSTGQEVNFLNDTVSCRDMDWTGTLFNPFFNAPSGLLHVGGSLILTDSMFIQYPFAVSFEATTPGQVVNTGHQNLVYAMFDGVGGSWAMLSDLYSWDLYVNQGDFFSNNHYILLAGQFVSNSGLSRSIFLGKSEIIVDSSWNFSSAGLTLQADSCNITIQGDDIIFNGAGQTYHHVDFIDPKAVVNDNNFFDRVITYGHITFTGNNTFDSLMIANPSNPADTVYFQSGSTQTINLLMETNSAPSQIINIQSTTPGLQSTISLPAGHTICLNYVNLTDQNAIGGGDFFAGALSTNISNNSGWQFIDCSPALSAVWPGDANHDLIVDNFDVLTIATAYDGYGFLRPAGSNNFTAQPCMDWFFMDANNVNYKYADSDGDMIIGEPDTVAIFQNYGQTHPARFANPGNSVVTTGPDLYFQVPANVLPGSIISVPVLLGTSSLQAMNVYGIAFNVNYDTAMIVPGSVGVDYSGSWLVSAGNNIHIGKQFPLNGQIDLGFARIDHQNVSGDGMIVTLTFEIKNNVSGYCPLVLSHVRLISSTGVILPVTPASSSMIIGVNEQSSSISASVYPNPAGQILTVSIQGNSDTKTEMKITNIAGQIILQQKLIGENSQVDVSALAAGSYFILLTDESDQCFSIPFTIEH